MGRRIRRTYAVTNMVKPKNAARIQEKLDEIGLEVLCRLPYDENLEQMVFENSCIVKTEGLDVWEPVKSIVETVRRT